MVEEVDFLGPYPLDLTEALFNGVARSITAIYKWGNPNPQPIGVVACSTFEGAWEKMLEKYSGNTPKNALAIRMSNIAENYNGYNPSAMLRTGWVAGVTPSGAERIVFHLTPVLVTFEMRFYSDQMATISNFIRNWLHRFRYDSGFDINLQNPDFAFHINVQGNDSFNYPTNDNSEDATKFFDCECRAFSYIGHYEAVPTINRINYGIVLDPNNTRFAQNALEAGTTFDGLLDTLIDPNSQSIYNTNNYVADYMSAWSIELTGSNPELDLPADLLAAQEVYEQILKGEIPNLPLQSLGKFTSFTPGR